jgi:2-haloacid dehalogenase
MAVSPDDIKALTFDVFGTVVDWRTSVAREANAFFKKHGIAGVDGIEFAMEWRKLYQPAMTRVRSGEMPFTKLDVLHRMNLDELLQRYGIGGLPEDEIDYLNRAWHRLDPWPDSVEGLTRLKKKYIIATQSNGNIALMVNMAKHAGLPWDAILGSEVVRHYKPCPDAYINCADALGLPPEACMMTAAHNGDLVAASQQGFRTAFVLRPVEYGPDQHKDNRAEHDFDFIANSFVELADQLGCPK